MGYFICGRPVPPDRFVGRRAERDRLLGFIADHGESVAIVSEPGAGKTSLLNYLGSVGRDEAQRLSKRRLLFARVDAPVVADGFTRARFWRYLFAKIDGAPPFASGDGLLSALHRACDEQGYETTAITQLLERLADTGYRLVLFVDELDYLTERCARADPAFLASLRSLLKSGDMTLVGTSRKPLAWLNHESSVAGVAGSACFGTLRELALGALTPAEVDEIAGAGRARFTADDMAFIWAASGGYPRLTQSAADALWEALGEVPADGAVARQRAGTALVAVADEALDDMWRQWSPETRFVFASVALAHLEMMGEAARWASPEGSATAGIGEDAVMFRQEVTALERYGLVSSGRVLAIAFLASFGGKLRLRSRTPASWNDWIREEGWTPLLSPARRNIWAAVLRPRAAAVETALDVLLAASASVGLHVATSAFPAPPPAAGGAVAFFASPTPRRVRLFCSYAHADDQHLRKLKAHLAALTLEHRIETWFDRLIAPGVDWSREIHANLDAAEIVLLLVSADFFDSDYCTGIELRRAMQRHDHGQARVIPIIVRAVDWGHLPVASLQALPRNTQPITSWTNEDEAWRDVAMGIRSVVEEITGPAPGDATR